MKVCKFYGDVKGIEELKVLEAGGKIYIDNESEYILIKDESVAANVDKFNTDNYESEEFEICESEDLIEYILNNLSDLELRLRYSEYSSFSVYINDNDVIDEMDSNNAVLRERLSQENINVYEVVYKYAEDSLKIVMKKRLADLINDVDRLIAE